MLRWMKWIAPVAGVAMVLSFNAPAVRADDQTPPSATTPAAKASVTVTVVDSDGKPVSDATVTLVTSAGGKRKKNADPNSPPTTQAAKSAPIASGTTDADGKAVLANIPDGKYVARARVKHGGNGREMVSVIDQKDVSVTVTLKARAPKTN